MHRTVSDQVIIATQTVVKVFVLGVFFIFMAFPSSGSSTAPSSQCKRFMRMCSRFQSMWNHKLPAHLGSRNFPRYFMNSVLVTTTSTVGIVLLSSLAGFIFGRVRFRAGSCYSCS